MKCLHAHSVLSHSCVSQRGEDIHDFPSQLVTVAAIKTSMYLQKSTDLLRKTLNVVSRVFTIVYIQNRLAK